MPKAGDTIFNFRAALEALEYPSARGGHITSIFVHRNEGVGACFIGQEALMQTRELFGAGMGHNDAADAFRHAYWSYRMTEEYGASLAQQIGDRHESQGLRDAGKITRPQLYGGSLNTHVAPNGELLKDLFNNHLGREIYLRSAGADEGEELTDAEKRERATQRILAALDRGDLQTEPFRVPEPPQHRLQWRGGADGRRSY